MSTRNTCEKLCRCRVIDPVRGMFGAIAAIFACAGCSAVGVVTDGSSLSYGPARAGVLLDPASLPKSGDGYFIPPRWASRGLNYGTEELVSMVVYTAREVARQLPKATLSIGDMSPRVGGRSRWHRSHQTGRDVDVLFLAKDENGKAVLSNKMWHFDAEGRALHSPEENIFGESGESGYQFDDYGNWTVVKSLLTNPIAEVQYIFIAETLKQRLLDTAKTYGESKELIEMAGYLLHQPSDSLVHDDHMHVRILCSRADLVLGCEDQGVLRWVKKGYKYVRQIERNISVPMVDRSFGSLLTSALVYSS